MNGGEALVLSGAGPQSAPVVTLSWALFIGAAAILALVLAMLAIALWGPARWRAPLGREGTVFGLGFVFPIVVLSLLLVIGLAMTASLASSRAAPDALHIRVKGERWWWRIHYPGFETANELVIPVGRPVHLELRSDNVLHSFWVPELSGKRDMVPGKINHLNIQADRAGVYFGICAEYCAGPHALMQFRVRALPAADYARWEALQRLPGATPSAPAASRGAERFAALGCGSCHTVRGTGSVGIAGPDLTHIASRLTIGAGVLPMSQDNLTRWTRETDRLKPANLMPAYPHLSADEADAVSDYLVTLR